ncbi:MAG: VWA domain-containing protein [Thermotogae bacterium]|nr:VWA domain-containing protein [Thermotogota bacterium]
MLKTTLLLMVLLGVFGLGFATTSINGLELQDFPILRLNMLLEGNMSNVAMTLYEDGQEVKIEYAEIKARWEHPMTDIVFLIDNSRSIKGFEQLIVQKTYELLLLMDQYKIDYSIAVIGFSDSINTLSFPKTLEAFNRPHTNPFTSDPSLIIETVNNAVVFDGNHPSKPFDMMAVAASLPFREKASKMIILFSDECPVESQINPKLYRALSDLLIEKSLSLSIFYDFQRESFYWEYYKNIAEASGGFFLDLNQSQLLLPVLTSLVSEKREIWIWFRSHKTAFDREQHVLQLKNQKGIPISSPFYYRFPDDWAFLRINTITATPMIVAPGAPVYVKVRYYPFSEETEIVFDISQGFTLVERYGEDEVLLLAPNNSGFYRIPVTVSRGKESLDGCVVVYVN